jgi:hypothetical protein
VNRSTLDAAVTSTDNRPIVLSLTSSALFFMKDEELRDNFEKSGERTRIINLPTKDG